MHRHHDAGSGYAWLDGHASTDAFSETFNPSTQTDHWNPGDDKLFPSTNTTTP